MAFQDVLDTLTWNGSFSKINQAVELALNLIYLLQKVTIISRPLEENQDVHAVKCMQAGII